MKIFFSTFLTVLGTSSAFAERLNTDCIDLSNNFVGSYKLHVSIPHGSEVDTTAEVGKLSENTLRIGFLETDKKVTYVSYRLMNSVAYNNRPTCTLEPIEDLNPDGSTNGKLILTDRSNGCYQFLFGMLTFCKD